MCGAKSLASNLSRRVFAEGVDRLTTRAMANDEHQLDGRPGDRNFGCVGVCVVVFV